MEAEQGTELVSEPDTREIAKALAAAQAEMQPPKKSHTAKIATKTGPDFAYTYASLDDVIATIRAVFPRHGLAFVQDETSGQGWVAVTTILLHESGERLTFGPLTLPAPGTAQGIGSALTYARRYALQAATGIAAEDDDDGALTRPSAATGKVTEATMKRLHAMARDKGKTHEDLTNWAGANLGIESLKELTRDGAKRLMDELDALPNVEAGGTEAVGEESSEGKAATAPPATTDRDALRELWAEAASLAGSKAAVLDWYREEYKITGSVSTKNIDAVTLEHLVDLMRQASPPAAAG